MSLVVRIEKHADVWLVHLGGVLNHRTRDELRGACRSLVNLPMPHIVVDLAELEDLDRPGLTMLMSLQHLAVANQGCLVLTRVPPRLSDTFREARVGDGLVANISDPSAVRRVVDSCLAAEIAKQQPIHRHERLVGTASALTGPSVW